jgi:GTP cyclohydrolase II
VATVPLEIAPSDTTRGYLTTKKRKLGHRLTKV